MAEIDLKTVVFGLFLIEIGTKNNKIDAFLGYIILIVQLIKPPGKYTNANASCQNKV